jgi:hypothetical protein
LQSSPKALLPTQTPQPQPRLPIRTRLFQVLRLPPIQTLLLPAQRRLPMQMRLPPAPRRLLNQTLRLRLSMRMP